MYRDVKKTTYTQTNKNSHTHTKKTITNTRKPTKPHRPVCVRSGSGFPGPRKWAATFSLVAPELSQGGHSPRRPRRPESLYTKQNKKKQLRARRVRNNKWKRCSIFL